MLPPPLPLPLHAALFIPTAKSTNPRTLIHCPMPPRKSDPMGRSDTISAQFVLKDDVQIGSSAPALSSARIQTASPATPVAMETDRPSESAPPTDKDKKEGRDATTIEVYLLLNSCLVHLYLSMSGHFVDHGISLTVTGYPHLIRTSRSPSR